MTRLADQQSKSNHAQIASLALGVSSPRQIAGGPCINVGVEVRGVEREHVCRQLETADGSLRNGHLRLLQLLIGHLLCDTVKGLPGERSARQTRQPGQATVEKLTQFALGPRCTSAL